MICRPFRKHKQRKHYYSEHHYDAVNFAKWFHDFLMSDYVDMPDYGRNQLLDG